MTNTIDWNAPLEVVWSDGSVESVTATGPNSDGQYCLNVGGWFDADGTINCKTGAYVRNRSEKPSQQYPAELVERMVKCLRKIADQPGHVQQHVARTILAELEPVDPDLELAREIVDAGTPWQSQQDMVLAAIKRVRAEKCDD